MTIVYIVLASLLISMGALVGIFTLSLREKLVEKMLLLLVSLSAGALMGGAFFHLLPEALEILDPHTIFPVVLLSFVLFFFLEKLFHWRHCHKGHCHIHSFGYMNLIGDSIHNFIDGIVLAVAFITDFHLGVITTIAIALHEIPQEIGDFGVLLYAGFHKKKALLANFIVALTVVLGGVFGYYLSHVVEGFVPYLLPFAAGGFLYIASSDLMPEIRKEENIRKSMLSFVIFLIGVGFMYLVTLLHHE